MCSRRLRYAVLWSLAGCGADPSVGPDWIAEVLRHDPLFGGGPALLARLAGDPDLAWAGDAGAREVFLGAVSARLDAAAADHLRQHVPADLVRQVLPFLRSDAGRSMTAAEQRILTLCPIQADDFVTRIAGQLGDPDLVGPAARRQVAELRLAAGVSVSPAGLAQVLGLGQVEPAEARQIAAFLASAPGASWLGQRQAAFAAVERRFLALRNEVQARGFLTSRRALPDLVLPRAEFADGPGAAGR